MSRTAIMAAAVLLLAAIVFLFLPGSGDEETVGDTGSGLRPPSGSTISSKSPRPDSGPPPREQRRKPSEFISEFEPSPNFSVPGEHTVEQLKDFMLPHIRLEDVTLEEALSALLQKYADVCARTNQTPVPFSLSIEDTGGDRFSLTLRNQSFLSALRMVAAHAGAAYDRDDTKLTFQSLDSVATPATDVISYMYTVPPTFLDDLQAILPQQPGDSPAEALSLLRQLGMIRSTGSTVSVDYDPATSSLTLTTSPGDRERFDEFFDDLVNQSPRFIKYSTQLVTSPNELDFKESRSLSPGELEGLLTDYSDDLNFQSTPSVVMRAGQNAELELVQRGDSPDDWTGLIVSPQSNLYGLGISTNTRIDSRPHNEGSADDGINPLVAGRVEIDAILPNGHTLIRHIFAPDGTHQYYLLTPQIIDAMGRPVSNQAP